MIIYYVIAYILVSIIVTAFAVGRRISFVGAFLVSVIMTPVLGLFAILKSGKKVKISRYVSKYHCPRCGAEYVSDDGYCPSCLAEGKKVHPQQMFIQMAG